MKFLVLDGEILEFNEELETNPELVNDDPYGKGWMVKVGVSDVAQLNTLLSAAEYEALIGE